MTFRFSFGPWNIHEGADPFGPPVRQSYDFQEKLAAYRELGFEGVQFHDDDIVPDIAGKTHAQVMRRAGEVRRILDGHGLVTEIVAPRLWEGANTIDGAYTSNDPNERLQAIERSKQTIDIAREMGTNNLVLWLAREGTYIREAKNPVDAVHFLIDAINKLLDYDKTIRILIEPKPNEPMDQAYIPTIGHALSLAYRSTDPDRVGGLIESAHCILAGLDPSDEMGYALAHGKLWSVHLNDQNGLKYDQDKSFGSDNLRRAFNQVRVLADNGYGSNGEFIGLDVKAMRTQPRELSFKHLANSRSLFLRLADKVRTYDREKERQLVAARDYEGLDEYVLDHLLGR
ncbi:TIM barrel protein [Paenibacillus ginsengarvi]|uniref:Xylose isomerase n=1 Tax=Paenibacillus ginsengarvi TaxID=400777 RepID=A0A3B0APC1_9BACL|nr:TIM barrel protein [Paenibacillus ginsengarvi]RKN62004.1 xylose isomerase [Paenibacillus ginsengarvi]